MSGGYFEYTDSLLKDTIFNYRDIPQNVLEDREISELTYDLLSLLHDFDWYKSGDTCRETYLKAKDEFKKKWLDNRGVRVKRIVDGAMESIRQELYETYNISQNENTKDYAPVIHARWINREGPNEWGEVEEQCSNCLHGDAHDPTIHVPHCWFCGAQMDEEVKVNGKIH